jgi:hypothetical protein
VAYLFYQKFYFFNHSDIALTPFLVGPQKWCPNNWLYGWCAPLLMAGIRD